jgi:type IV pilus assembly protein PilM
VEPKDHGSRQKNRPARSTVNRITTPPSHPLRLLLSGRLLDKNNPISNVSSDSYERANRLLASFAESRFVTAVENERFDNSQPGILHFDFTLLISPQQPL